MPVDPRIVDALARHVRANIVKAGMGRLLKVQPHAVALEVARDRHGWLEPAMMSALSAHPEFRSAIKLLGKHRESHKLASGGGPMPELERARPLSPEVPRGEGLKEAAESRRRAGPPPLSSAHPPGGPTQPGALFDAIRRKRAHEDGYLREMEEGAQSPSKVVSDELSLPVPDEEKPEDFEDARAHAHARSVVLNGQKTAAELKYEIGLSLYKGAKAEAAITPEMREFFDKRTAAHIGAVKANMLKLAPEFKDIEAEIEERADRHDQLKLSEPELTPYIWLTWMRKHRSAGKPFEYPEGIEAEVIEATRHHVLNSDHHPEHWAGEAPHISAKDTDSAERAIDAGGMDDPGVLDMVADWKAMGDELGNTARSWYDKVKGKRYKFSDKQSALIEKALGVLEPAESKQARELRKLAGIVSRGVYMTSSPSEYAHRTVERMRALPEHSGVGDAEARAAKDQLLEGIIDVPGHANRLVRTAYVSPYADMRGPMSKRELIAHERFHASRPLLGSIETLARLAGGWALPRAGAPVSARLASAVARLRYYLVVLSSGPDLYPNSKWRLLGGRALAALGGLTKRSRELYTQSGPDEFSRLYPSDLAKIESKIVDKPLVAAKLARRGYIYRSELEAAMGGERLQESVTPDSRINMGGTTP
jgi:hypothetical protein